MDSYNNPYSPDAGTPPPVGREDILKKADILLGRIKNGKPEKSFLMTGLRGVGKTVLLVEIQKKAEIHGYKTIFVEAHEDKSLGALLTPHLRTLLYSLDIEPELGFADSGDIEIDLPQLLVAIGEAAIDGHYAIAILVDEIQYLSKKELGALIMAMHRLQQRQLPVVLVGAGLPVLPGLAGESKSYAERLFNFPNIGELEQ